MDADLTFLDDPQFDIENHEVPFSPLENAPELVELLHVEGWDCSEIMHEAEAETECHELIDGEWVYTGTVDHGSVEHHAISWLGDYAVPGIENSSRVKVGIEFAEDTIFTDENSEPTHMGDGYILFGDAGTADGEYAGEIRNKVYANLAEAVVDAVRLLSFIRDGLLPEETTTERPVRDLIEDLTGTELPE